MILVRSANDGKKIEGALLSKNIPYQFVGGLKLIETLHVRYILSLLRIVANPKDEIAWLKFLLLWPGIGNVTANRIIEKIRSENTHFPYYLEKYEKIPKLAYNGILSVANNMHIPGKAVQQAFYCLESNLESKFQNDNWEDRKKDITIIIQLAEGYSSLPEFLENFLLEPVYTTEGGQDDIVTISTIHSAKGTESSKCYVVNVSPGKYPSIFHHFTEEQREEERRVLYVALTRAQDELIITGIGRFALDIDKNSYQSDCEHYFFNNLSSFLLNVYYHYEQSWDLQEIDSLTIDYDLLRAVCNSKDEKHLKIIRPLLKKFINQYDHRIPVKYGVSKKYYCHTDVQKNVGQCGSSWIRFYIQIHDWEFGVNGDVGMQIFLPPEEAPLRGHEICQDLAKIFHYQQIEGFEFSDTAVGEIGTYPGSIWHQFNVFTCFKNPLNK